MLGPTNQSIFRFFSF